MTKTAYIILIILPFALTNCDQVELKDIKKNNAEKTERSKDPNANQVLAYLVEDHITNWQLDYSQNPEDVQFFDHRYVLRGQLDFISSNALDSIVSSPLVVDSVQQKNILLEYFTGHKCGNCPAQSRSAFESIETLYFGQVNIIKIHAGFFAQPNSATSQMYTYDFRTSIGNELYTNYGIASVPIGMLDRKNYPGLSQLLSPSSWLTQIAAQLEISADFGIWGTVTFNEISRDIFLKSDIKDVASKKIYNVSFRGKLDNAWNKDQCYIIIAIYNPATKEILQSRRYKL